MPSGKILRQLIKAGTSGDLNTFKQVSETVIREERLKQHHLLANDLEKILYGDLQSPVGAYTDRPGTRSASAPSQGAGSGTR